MVKRLVYPNILFSSATLLTIVTHLGIFCPRAALSISDWVQFHTLCPASTIISTRCKYFDPCYARAAVVSARFLAAAFSDGSYLAHVNGAYLRHVTFCIVRGPPLFIVSPISERGSRAAAHLTCRGTPTSPILAVM